jgi:hypothetical protein
MALDPEELVILTDHGVMKLRSAVARAMILRPKERKRATIVREGEPVLVLLLADECARCRHAMQTENADRPCTNL